MSKNQKAGWGTAVAIVGGGLLSLLLMYVVLRNPRIVIDAVRTDQDRIDELFSSRDGSHLKLTELILSKLHDPASYQHIETTFTPPDRGSEDRRVMVFTVFRCRPQSGGMAEHRVEAYSSIDGEELDVISWKMVK